MDRARYIIALIVLLSLPPALLLWIFIHPFASFWRRLGMLRTYLLLSFPVAGVMVLLFLGREDLLRVEYGTNPLLTGLAVLSILTAAILGRARGKHLTFRTLAGAPELSLKGFPGELLTHGIYGRMRNPRYAEVMFWTLGYVLFANYLATYIAFAVAIPTLHVVVVLEERELRERFGRAYEEYCNRVPRYLPRFSKGS
jgi:protein-S-isoprenylcysteine O-methyltransferase Ste14